MATYYVKTDGDDAATGLSWANAWETMDRALPDWDGAGTKVDQGDTINVASGDYGELDDSCEEDTDDTGRRDWITYIGDSDDKPILHNVWFKNTGYAYLKFQHFYFKEPNSGGLYEHAVEISGAGFASKRTSYLYFDNCIFESDNTSFKQSQNLLMRYCDYIWFYDCEIIGGWVGIKANYHYTNITFSGGSIHDQWSDMFDPWSEEPGEIASDVLIEDMTFYNLIPIEGVTDANEHMDFIQSGGGGLKHGNINNFTVRRCSFHFGYDPDGWKQGNYNGLIFQHSGNNFTFENNLTYGMSSNSGFNINGTIAGLNIINNTLAHSSDNPTWPASIDSSCTTVKNYNNIYHILFNMEPGDAEVSQDNNIYYDYDNNSVATIGANSSELGTLALVEALFTSYNVNIFTLPSDSIAVDFGNASEAPAVDILGETRGTTPDAGCYEYIEENIAMMTNAFLTRAISSFRRYTDEPTTNAKYTDAVLIQMLEEAYAFIIAEINRCSIEPIVAKFNVTYVAGTSTYALPQLMGAVSAVYYETTNGYKIFYDSRSPYNPQGRGIHIVGNTLHVQPGILSDGRVITIEYIPSGTARLHDGTCTVDTTGKLVTFGATPTDGTLDTHANAYAGSIFRIVSDTDTSYNYIQERTITGYVNTTGVATLDTALSPNAGDVAHSGTTSYEIAPAIHLGLDHTIALYLAYWVAAIEGSITRGRLLRGMWQDALRNLRLNAYYSNLVDCRKMRSDNYDNKKWSGRKN